jgi:flagellar basal-body rod protein FlgB
MERAGRVTSSLTGTARAEGQRMSGLFGGVDSLQSSLDYHLFRHKLLVSNLAHVDTPGYTPKDVAAPGFGEFGETLDLAMTKGGVSLPAAGAGPAGYTVFADPSPSGASLDGNSVSLDREAAKVASNQIRYDVVTVLTQSEFSDLHFVTGDGRS